MLWLIGAKDKCYEPFDLSQGEGEEGRCQAKASALASHACKPVSKPGFHPQGDNCWVHSFYAGLFVSIKKKKTCPPAKPSLRGAQRKKKTRRTAVQGWDSGDWLGNIW